MAVCAADSYCCDIAWDIGCTLSAAEICAGNDCEIDVELTFDGDSDEIGFTITQEDDNDAEIADVDADTYDEDEGTTIVESYDVANGGCSGCYVLTLTDTEENGLSPPGLIEIRFRGVVMYRDISFRGAEKSYRFGYC